MSGKMYSFEEIQNLSMHLYVKPFNKMYHEFNEQIMYSINNDCTFNLNYDKINKKQLIKKFLHHIINDTVDKMCESILNNICRFVALLNKDNDIVNEIIYFKNFYGRLVVHLYKYCNNIKLAEKLAKIIIKYGNDDDIVYLTKYSGFCMEVNIDNIMFNPQNPAASATKYFPNERYAYLIIILYHLFDSKCKHIDKINPSFIREYKCHTNLTKNKKIQDTDNKYNIDTLLFFSILNVQEYSILPCILRLIAIEENKMFYSENVKNIISGMVNDSNKTVNIIMIYHEKYPNVFCQFAFDWMLSQNNNNYIDVFDYIIYYFTYFKNNIPLSSVPKLKNILINKNKLFNPHICHCVIIIINYILKEPDMEFGKLLLKYFDINVTFDIDNVKSSKMKILTIIDHISNTHDIFNNNDDTLKFCSKIIDAIIDYDDKINIYFENIGKPIQTINSNDNDIDHIIIKIYTLIDNIYAVLNIISNKMINYKSFYDNITNKSIFVSLLKCLNNYVLIVAKILPHFYKTIRGIHDNLYVYISVLKSFFHNLLLNNNIEAFDQLKREHNYCKNSYNKLFDLFLNISTEQHSNTDLIHLIKYFSENNIDHDNIDIPEEFLDPITFELLKNPILLPDTDNVIVNEETIVKMLLVKEENPYTRTHLTFDMIKKYNVENKQIIDEFKERAKKYY